MIFWPTSTLFYLLDQAAKILGEKKMLVTCNENAIFNKKFLQRSVKITTKFVLLIVKIKREVGLASSYKSICRNCGSPSSYKSIL